MPTGPRRLVRRGRMRAYPRTGLVPVPFGLAVPVPVPVPVRVPAVVRVALAATVSAPVAVAVTLPVVVRGVRLRLVRRWDGCCSGGRRGRRARRLRRVGGGSWAVPVAPVVSLGLSLALRPGRA